eukprot:GHVU01229972.1.p2 GENE.GHVU01229972.1~~GHVU01229972.1.p2  ORF type:complete len:171 (-),score=28.62 GHVU01229972.1:23-535(-)
MLGVEAVATHNCPAADAAYSPGSTPKACPSPNGTGGQWMQNLGDEIDRRPFSPSRCYLRPRDAADPRLSEPYSKVTLRLVGLSAGTVRPEAPNDSARNGLTLPLVEVCIDGVPVYRTKTLQRRSQEWNECIRFNLYNPNSVLSVKLHDHAFRLGGPRRTLQQIELMIPRV